MEKPSLLLRFHKTVKQVGLRKGISAADLSHLITSLFQVKDRLLGLTDKQGKIYDLDWVCKNHHVMPRGEPLTLLTQNRQTTESVLSFGTEKSKYSMPDTLQERDLPRSPPRETKERSRVEHQPQRLFVQSPPAKQTPGRALGVVNNLTAFEKLFLERGRTTVIVSTQGEPKLDSRLKYFLHYSEGEEVARIYSGMKKILEVPLQNLHVVERRVVELQEGGGRQEEQKSNYSFDPVQPQFPQFLEKMLESGEIEDNHYYKLKCYALQFPKEFSREFGFDEQVDYEEFVSVIASRIERDNPRRWVESREGQPLLSREGRRVNQSPSRELHFSNNQIPIIVRRNDNKILKISTDWPLNFQQERYVQIINELELKGLLEDYHSRTIRTMVFEESLQVARIINAFVSEELDQLQLARALRQIVDKRRQRAFTPDSPEERSKMLVQVLSKLVKNPKELEALCQLAHRHNESLLAYFQIYLAESNEQQFLERLRKVLSNAESRKEESAPEFGHKAHN